jgi:hypothetical protein
MGIPMGVSTSTEPAGGGLSERLCRVLAGADTGAAGAVLVLSWLVFIARMQGGYWWTNWNVAGALFYGERVYGMGFGVASLAGAALLFLLYAALGVAFAMLARPRGFAFNLLAGVTVALVWHQAAAFLFFPRWGPGVMFYLHPAVMLPANVIFGLALVRYGPRFRKIARLLGDPAWAAEYSVAPAAPPLPPVFREVMGAPPVASVSTETAASEGILVEEQTPTAVPGAVPALPADVDTAEGAGEAGQEEDTPAAASGAVAPPAGDAPETASDEPVNPPPPAPLDPEPDGAEERHRRPDC